MIHRRQAVVPKFSATSAKAMLLPYIGPPVECSTYGVVFGTNPSLRALVWKTKPNIVGLKTLSRKGRLSLRAD